LQKFTRAWELHHKKKKKKQQQHHASGVNINSTSSSSNVVTCQLPAAFSAEQRDQEKLNKYLEAFY